MATLAHNEQIYRNQVKNIISEERRKLWLINKWSEWSMEVSLSALLEYIEWQTDRPTYQPTDRAGTDWVIIGKLHFQKNDHPYISSKSVAKLI